MTFFKAIAAVLGSAGATISSPWSDISYSSPTTSGTNEDRTITGSGTVTTSDSGLGSLEYRLDSGSWTEYAGGFSITSGQTLGWRYLALAANASHSEMVRVNGVLLDTFQVTVTGF